MDWALMIPVITAVAAIIQAHHANAAAAEANRVAKQELESVTKHEPKLHFTISAELKSGADGKNVIDSDELFIMNYGDAPRVLSRHSARKPSAPITRYSVKCGTATAIC